MFLPAVCSVPWDDCVMQGRSRQDRELLDAGEVAGHLVPAGSVFAFLAEHRRELFPDSTGPAGGGGSPARSPPAG